MLAVSLATVSYCPCHLNRSSFSGNRSLSNEHLYQAQGKGFFSTIKVAFRPLNPAALNWGKPEKTYCPAQLYFRSVNRLRVTWQRV